MICFPQSIGSKIQTNLMLNEQQHDKPNFRLSRLIYECTQILEASKLLIVGVGGIGCELLKVLCKSCIHQVHIIDMDTIELSNLNRQFLFKPQHRGMSKALVAQQSLNKINPNFKVVAHHSNIREVPICFFRQFSAIILALDNVEARNYVNKVAVRLVVPLIDAGTLGYKGNVTSMMRGVSKCYACQPKSANQKSYPVCTIRMRPEKPIHCIVWAKMLFEAMFGPTNIQNDMKDLAKLSEANSSLQVLVQLFERDIMNIKTAKAEGGSKLSEADHKRIRSIPQQTIQKWHTTCLIDSFNGFQSRQSLQKQLSLFSQALNRLQIRRKTQQSIQFEKDDDIILHFVASAANLRMHCFSIEQQSFNQIKNMAGNIVPAIASTNSIVAGLQITEVVKLILKSTDKMKSYYVQNQQNKIIPLKLEHPCRECSVCSQKNAPVIIEANLCKYKVKSIIELIEKYSNLSEFSINVGSSQVYNSEESGKMILEKNIWDFNHSVEVEMMVTNEQTSKQACMIWLIHNPEMNEERISNTEQFYSQLHEEQIKAKSDSDSDMVICEEDEVEIIEVNKRNPPMGKQIQSSLKKVKLSNE